MGVRVTGKRAFCRLPRITQSCQLRVKGPENRCSCLGAFSEFSHRLSTQGLTLPISLTHSSTFEIFQNELSNQTPRPEWRDLKSEAAQALLQLLPTNHLLTAVACAPLQRLEFNSVPQPSFSYGYYLPGENVCLPILHEGLEYATAYSSIKPHSLWLWLPASLLCFRFCCFCCCCFALLCYVYFVKFEPGCESSMILLLSIILGSKWVSCWTFTCANKWIFISMLNTKGNSQHFKSNLPSPF